jgi:putative inorganic carbon (HCO3(-)) transporter
MPKHLDHLTFGCILAAVFLLPISFEFSSFFLFVAAALWAGKMVFLKEILWKRTHLNKFIALYAFFAAVSIINAPDKNFSIYNYVHLMGKYILAYYLVINNVNSPKQIKMLVYALLSSAVLVVFYGFYQYFSGIDISSFMWVDKNKFPDLTTRVFSTFGNPNLLAGFLLVIISLAFSLSLYEKSFNIKTCFAVVTLAAGLCLIMTYSRGLWLSLFATLFIYGKFYDKRIFWASIPILTIIVFADANISARAASLINPADTSSALRLALWDSAWQMILKHPVLGIGWGSYWLVYPDYDYFIKDTSIIIYHAHNMYLNIAAETGFLGLAAFLAVLWGHISAAFGVFLKTDDAGTKGLMLGMLAAMTGLIVSGFTDYILFGAQTAMLFWLLNAIIVCQSEKK